MIQSAGKTDHITRKTEMGTTKRSAYKPSENLQDADEYLFSEEFFDSKGNVVKSVYYDEEGSVLEQEHNKFNEKNIIIETVHYEGTDTLIQKVNYDYEFSDGFLTKKIQLTTYMDGACDRLVEYYDGGRISRAESFEDDKLTECEVYSYSDDKILSHKTFDGKERELRRREFHHEDSYVKITSYEKNRFKEEIEIEYEGENIIARSLNNGSFVETQFYSYDESGNLAEIVSMHGNIRIGKRSYRYDSNNNLISEVIEHSVGGGGQFAGEFKEYGYDEHGRVVFQNDDGDTIRYEYS